MNSSSAIAIWWEKLCWWKTRSIEESHVHRSTQTLYADEARNTNYNYAHKYTLNSRSRSTCMHVQDGTGYDNLFIPLVDRFVGPFLYSVINEKKKLLKQIKTSRSTCMYLTQISRTSDANFSFHSLSVCWLCAIFLVV